ncbi:MAG: hypothetical protein ACREWG_02055 [Gammaproteobacteria bacterium]
MDETWRVTPSDALIADLEALIGRTAIEVDYTCAAIACRGVETHRRSPSRKSSQFNVLTKGDIIKRACYPARVEGQHQEADTWHGVKLVFVALCSTS